MSNIHEEEALGKAYDSRLMKRLLDYMRPYRWRVIIALALVAIVTPLELAPPLLFKKTIDDYLVPVFEGGLPLAKAWNGGLLFSLAYLAVLMFDFLPPYMPIRIAPRVGPQ